MRVLLVDDERPARERLRRLLADASDVEVVGEASDGREALERIEADAPEVVFLDIEMPGLGGLEVAAALEADGPHVVFVTAYDEYALQAFESAAVDYLVKPVKAGRLQRALERLRRRAPGPGEQPDLSRLVRQLQSRTASRRLAVKSGARYVVLDPRNIRLVSAQDHYSLVRHGDEEVLCDDGLDALGGRLEADRFLRVHRSYIVNLDWLATLEREGERRYVAVLADPARTRVPVSRDRLAGVKAALGVE